MLLSLKDSAGSWLTDNAVLWSPFLPVISIYFGLRNKLGTVQYWLAVLSESILCFCLSFFFFLICHFLSLVLSSMYPGWFCRSRLWHRDIHNDLWQWPRYTLSIYINYYVGFQLPVWMNALDILSSHQKLFLYWIFLVFQKSILTIFPIIHIIYFFLELACNFFYSLKLKHCLLNWNIFSVVVLILCSF